MCIRYTYYCGRLASCFRVGMRAIVLPLCLLLGAGLLSSCNQIRDEVDGVDVGDFEGDVGDDVGGDVGGSGDLDVAVELQYPDPPYGKTAGAVIANHHFTDSHGAEASMEDWMGTRLILLNSSAGRCAACSIEAGHLQDWYTQWADDGFLVVTALFEDYRYQPASIEFAQTWVEEHGCTHPVVIDPDVEMGQYYNISSTPMNMLIDGNSMKILEITTGFDEVSLRRSIVNYLGV